MQYQPNLQYFPDFLLLVWRRLNDDHSIEHINWDAVGRDILSTPDASDATVGGHNHHRGHVVLQCTIQEGEAFDVQHVYLQKQRELNKANLYYTLCFLHFHTVWHLPQPNNDKGKTTATLPSIMHSLLHSLYSKGNAGTSSTTIMSLRKT